MKFFLPLLIFSLMAGHHPLFAQKSTYQPSAEAYTADPAAIFLLPALNNDSLWQNELRQRQPGRPLFFATAIPLDLSPNNAGYWKSNPNGERVWYLGIQSPNAHSLNLAFDAFFLPPSASLYLYSDDFSRQIGPITALDNDSHYTWWSPIVFGTTVYLELRIADHDLPELQLHLSKANHDFANFSQTSNNTCFLDTQCNESNGWDIVNAYQDQIRSVVMVTIEGNRACTAFLINNTAANCRPFLMSAFHCNIDPENAPSIVAYWGFENPVCRSVNAPSNEGRGQGQLTRSNSGAAFRAGWEPSDMVLVELDDEPADDQAFFAGWDRSAQTPKDTVVGIHHPKALEKRISFSFQDTYTGSWETNDLPRPAGNHLIVPFWSVGSTAPASSGSPLFDKDGLVRGQLHGGAAACGLPEFDSYGRFYSSWTGGGSPATSLQYWLDPLGINPVTLPGKTFDYCAAALQAFPYESQLCIGDTTSFEVVLTGFIDFPVSLSLKQPLPPGLTVWLQDTLLTTQGVNTRLFVTTRENAIPASMVIGIQASGNQALTAGQVQVVLRDIPEPALLIQPEPGRVFIGNSPLFSWQNTGEDISWELQWSKDPLFEQLAFAQLTQTPQLSPRLPDNNGQYYWRVKSINTCGATLSEISDFYRFPDLSLRFGGNKVTVSPNPASESLQIGFSNPLAQPVRLNLFALNGALLHGENLAAGSTFFRIDLQYLPNGLYLLQLQQGDTRFVQKILVQHP
ncbi:MAG: T9SS type A sorting domain-containing protein [Saprospiraceae bacterium]|nr:T9SS type A sorting domain-containing protein [Saprospiraceae bacterium]MDP4998578.1 T9SS type A sorting domain-containing protein [Saprospiraceae bacterium]